jgi:ParB family chromosome partitioning protein
MKPSQFAKGFQARPDTTSSEKRTALDRLNAIDGLVKNNPKSNEAAERAIAAVASRAEPEVDPARSLSCRSRPLNRARLIPGIFI